MGYYDYSLPQSPADVTKGLDSLGDALTDVLNRRQKAKHFAAEEAAKAETERRRAADYQGELKLQHDAQQARETRDQRDFSMRATTFKNTQAEKIRQALANGNTQLAQQLAAETPTFDPKTGAETGRATLAPGPIQDVGPEPQDPGEPTPLPGAPPEITARRRGLSFKMDEPLPISARPGAPEAPVPSISMQPGTGSRSPAMNGPTFKMDEPMTVNAGPGEPPPVPNVSMQQFDPEEQAALDARRFGEQQTAHAAFPGQHADYLAARRSAEQNRPYSLQMGPGEPTLTLDTASQRYGARTAAADDFLESLRGVAMDDKTKNAAAQIHAGILGGTIDPAKAGAMFQRERMGITQPERLQLQNVKDAAALERAKIPKPGIQLSERRFEASNDKDIRKETRTDIEKWLKASGLETAPKQREAMDQTLKQLKGNPKEQQAALVGMARATQGDNRFSDQDYRVFVQNGGVGTLDKVDNTLQQLVDGGFGDETKAVASQMATALRAVFGERLKRAAGDSRKEFVHNEIYDPQVAESVLEQRLGSDVFRRESDRGRSGPPEVAARKKGKAAASRKVTAPTVDDALKALGGM